MTAPPAPGAESGLGGARPLLAEAAARLTAAGVPGARLDARILLGHVLGIESAAVFSLADTALPAGVASAFGALVGRRAASEPVSRIIGRREFWSLDFVLAPATLDPRPDSETLIEALLELRPNRAAALSILDLGTGSGCLLLAALSEYPRARGLGVDASEPCCAAAASNAARLGLAERTAFRAADWGGGIDGPFDVVLCNPPYIPTADIAALAPEVRLHDPRTALDGGIDGLDAYRALAACLPRLLDADGLALLEVGAGQAAAVAELMQAGGLSVIKVRPDLAGIPRCVALRRASD